MTMMVISWCSDDHDDDHGDNHEVDDNEPWDDHGGNSDDVYDHRVHMTAWW